jgi:hypothetical protein
MAEGVGLEPATRKHVVLTYLPLDHLPPSTTIKFGFKDGSGIEAPASLFGCVAYLANTPQLGHSIEQRHIYSP